MCVLENLQSIFGLIFIPEDEVVTCWSELKPKLSLNSSLKPVLDYVKSMWISNDIYLINMWNVYRAVIDSRKHAKNFAEAQSWPPTYHNNAQCHNNV